MNTCQCQKPLVNAHGCCGYCGKGVDVAAVIEKYVLGETLGVERGIAATYRPINEVILPPSGAMADGLMEFVEKGQREAAFNTNTIYVSGECTVFEKGVEIQVDGGGTLFYNTPKPSDLEHATARWRDCLEVIEQTYKRHPNGVGVPQESIRGNALYVLDWMPDDPKRTSAVKVEHVVSVDAGDGIVGGIVNMVDSVMDLETFASLVVGGPFPLEVEIDGDE